ncbi:hypothetical protein LEP1GSC050_0767 [Leptospira broomii serovar Hurstbridge str. 5399]|uniref:Uncharacterized protein n=1 Tax=Leptospira broomii serovar Hurstbridge str. 5399 TaxID=1049789 RepID=T0FG74_9LEPT|nr:hypothetical protein LEP1GSC050_0767 [Leptospira broomii serovar Hurstbridge str. 5399]
MGRDSPPFLGGGRIGGFVASAYHRLRLLSRLFQKKSLQELQHRFRRVQLATIDFFLNITAN